MANWLKQPSGTLKAECCVHQPSILFGAQLSVQLISPALLSQFSTSSSVLHFRAHMRKQHHVANTRGRLSELVRTRDSLRLVLQLQITTVPTSCSPVLHYLRIEIPLVESQCCNPLPKISKSVKKLLLPLRKYLAAPAGVSWIE